MKRSEINALIQEARECFESRGWALPPRPRWDVTDFGLGDWRKHGLVLVNLCEEPEYCEKLMYARRGMETPAHFHRRKKEDIVSRWGTLRVTVWADEGSVTESSVSELKPVSIKLDGVADEVPSGTTLDLRAGQRVTLLPGVYHRFVPVSEQCLIGEVSTANDDTGDNFFVRSDIGRFPDIEEDEEPLVRLVSDRT
jgi:D-lyxose ketol-isomerase